MSKLTDVQIKRWVKAGERFEGRSDGDGLYLRFRKDDHGPTWRFRYRFKGKPRVMNLGAYKDLSLAQARKKAKELRAHVSLGHDVSGDKQQRKRDALAKIEKEKHAVTVADLADEYFERMILGRWKRPEPVRNRIERDIKGHLGKMAVEDVRPTDIDNLIKSIVKRGSPTMANNILRWVRQMFDFAVKRHMVQYNPAAVFDVHDAGGQESPRERALSRDELVLLFEAMRQASGLTLENMLTFKLLLLLATRKSELIGARVAEFDLDNAIWHLPAARTKTETAIDIPLAPQAVVCIRELIRLGRDSEWLLPARKRHERLLPYIHESTLNRALACLKPFMQGAPNFSIHDFRRTARTHLAALGVDPHIAERCLNHKIRGIEGVYNRHDYLPERREALATWAAFLETCETGTDWNVVSLRARAPR